VDGSSAHARFPHGDSGVFGVVEVEIQVSTPKIELLERGTKQRKNFVTTRRRGD
jgi:hypothetical protein